MITDPCTICQRDIFAGLSNGQINWLLRPPFLGLQSILQVPSSTVYPIKSLKLLTFLESSRKVQAAPAGSLFLSGFFLGVSLPPVHHK